MKKLNLHPFYVGQKVVCVKPIGDLIKDKIYTISHITKCLCGKICVGVGLVDYEFGYGKYYNAKCCGAKQISVGFYEFNTDRFAPIQQQNFPLIKLSKIIEKEKEQILIEN